MTALDNAFVKAFSQQNSPAPAALRPALPRQNDGAVATNEEADIDRQPAAPSLTDVAPAMFERFDSILTALENMPDLRVNCPPQRSNKARNQPTNIPIPPGEFSSVAFDVGPWTADAAEWTAAVEPPLPVDDSVLWDKGALNEGMAAAAEEEEETTEPEISCSCSAIRVPSSEPSAPTIEHPVPTIEPPSSNVEHSAPTIEPPPPTAELSSVPTIESPPPTVEPEPFRPAWQVDRFTWPRVCRRLLSRAADEWNRLADVLVDMCEGGNKTLGFAGCRRGEGATTLLLCAANRLAERGIRVAMVDADLRRPRLAKRLGVQPQFGWNETEEEASALDRAVVATSDGAMALAAVREPADQGGDASMDWVWWRECVERLRNHYDVVLVDLGPLENIPVDRGTPWNRNVGLDCVLLAHNHRVTPKNELTEMQHRLTEAGMNVAGIIENFNSGLV